MADPWNIGYPNPDCGCNCTPRVCGCLPTATTLNCTFYLLAPTLTRTDPATGCPTGSTGCGTIGAGSLGNYTTTLTYAGSGVSPYHPATTWDGFWVSPPVPAGSWGGGTHTATATIVLNFKCVNGSPTASVWIVIDCSNGCREIYDHDNGASGFPGIGITSCHPFAGSITISVGPPLRAITFSE